VPVVAAAADAVILGARIDQNVIGARAEHAGNSGEEARPAGAAVELHRGGEERQVAAGAREHAFALLPVVRPRAGTLRALLAQHAVCGPLKALAPFVLRELERLRRRGRLDALGEELLPVLLQLLDTFHVPDGGLGGAATPGKKAPQGR